VAPRRTLQAGVRRAEGSRALVLEDVASAASKPAASLGASCAGARLSGWAADDEQANDEDEDDELEGDAQGVLEAALQTGVPDGDP
jgi:hypothetical protein